MYKQPLLISVLMLLSLFLFSQQKTAKDTAATDSAAIVQLQMTQSYNQGKIDSLLRVRLENELKGMEKNSARSKSLEAELQKIREADSLRKHQQLEKLAQLRETNPPFPVAPFGDTLFNIYLRLGSTQPEERARRISERIQRLYEENFFRPDSLAVVPDEWGHEVSYKEGETILTVSEMDALWYQKGSEELALAYRDSIVKAIKAEREENSLTNWLKRIGLVALILIGAFLLVLAINKAYQYLLRWLDTKKAQLWKGLTLGKFRVFSARSQKMFLIRVIGLVRLLTIVLAVYLCLPLLFYVFPDTQDITNTLLHWIIAPAKNMFRGILDFLPNLFTITVIFLFTRYFVRGLKYLFDELGSGVVSVAGFHPDFARPTFNIVRFVLYAFMLVLIFPYLPGSSSPAFQGISVFLGVLFSLGSSSAINNIIAGLVITYMRPFRVGDRVKIGDIVGDVVEKSMLVIKLRTVKNEEITVPNSTVLTGNTINYSVLARDQGLIIHTTVTIGYDAPWRDVHEALIKAAQKTADVLKDPAPFVLQTSLDDFYVSYQLNAYTSEAGKQAGTYSELHQHIQDCFNEAGIEIMSPHYAALRDGNTITIPEAQRPTDYQPDAFRVRK